MSSTATKTSNIGSATALDAAAVLAAPPDQANMVALTGYVNRLAPHTIDLVLVGSEAATLAGASWYGWDLDLGLAVRLGPVNAGEDVTLGADLGHAEPIELVAGVYSHVGIGGGTLSAGTLDLHVRALEVASS